MQCGVLELDMWAGVSASWAEAGLGKLVVLDMWEKVGLGTGWMASSFAGLIP